MRVLLAKFAERAAQLVNQRSDAGGEMERVHVCGEVIHKGLLDMAHHRNDLLGEFGEAHGGRSRDKALSAAHKELGVKFIGEIVKLQTYGARGKMNFFRRASHAR